MNFTKEDLKKSQVYKDWVKEENVVGVYNVYKHLPKVTPAYIVIEKIGTPATGYQYSITRFFVTGEKIYVSSDFQGITAEQAMEAILDKYSNLT